TASAPSTIMAKECRRTTERLPAGTAKLRTRGIRKLSSKSGKCTITARGVQQDYAEAFRWYHKAAKQGDPNAQRVLQPQLTTLGKVWIAIEFLGTTFLLVSSYRSAARELLGL